MKKYYYVYRNGQFKYAPTVKHPTLADAQAESIRLATQHPGEAFEILALVGITQTTTAQTFWVDED
jgi:hypothetical protein